MKRFELLFAFLQLPLDYLAIVLAGFTAYALRFAPFITSIRPVRFALPWSGYWPLVLVAAAGWIAIFALAGLYHTNPNRKFSRDLARVIFACSTGFAAITVYVFFTLQKFDSRFLVLVGWLLAMVYAVAGRLLLRGIKGLCYRAGIGLRNVAIIGQEAAAVTIADTLRQNPRLGYRVVTVTPNFQAAALAPWAESLDEIILTNPRAQEEEALAAIEFAGDRHLTFKYSADLFATLTSNFSVSTLTGIPIIELRRTPLSGWGRIGKRLMDIIGGTILFMLSLPLQILIALAIIIETGRPVIYRNERVGQYGKRFIALKFRSMYQRYCTGPQFGKSGQQALQTEAELIEHQSAKLGPVYKIKDDPRVTPVGRWLRRWSLDELPQFINVIRGEMSLVGPRPHQPREVAQYEKRHRVLLALKPGLTGLAQISGRSDLTFEEEARLDTFYVEHWSLLMDLIILIKTPFIVLRRKGAW
ncbi:MAG: sugar transferase [Candidatus Magasanikbacteria bacterium]|nr:sugar transferase [Candidatus Magasanikbacteria bacterium]